MKAECRFFIAYFHAVMAMTYGAVPIIREQQKRLQVKPVVEAGAV